jgi:hypothetical protein
MFLGDGCNVGFAGEIKKHVKTPVATIGALGEPELMERDRRLREGGRLSKWPGA